MKSQFQSITISEKPGSLDVNVLSSQVKDTPTKNKTVYQRLNGLIKV